CAALEHGTGLPNQRNTQTSLPKHPSRRRSMAKVKMDFAQQNTERAMQATNWMRAIAEQNLNQSKASFDGFLTVARNAVRGVDQQAAAICENSFSVAEETLTSNLIGSDKVEGTPMYGTNGDRRRTHRAGYDRQI